MIKWIGIALVLCLLLSTTASAMTKEELNTLIATALNMNGLLCAEVVNVVPLKVSDNVYEVTCIEYRGGTGKKTYIYNAATG